MLTSRDMSYKQFLKKAQEAGWVAGVGEPFPLFRHPFQQRTMMPFVRINGKVNFRASLQQLLQEEKEGGR